MRAVDRFQTAKALAYNCMQLKKWWDPEEILRDLRVLFEGPLKSGASLPQVKHLDAPLDRLTCVQRAWLSSSQT